MYQLENRKWLYNERIIKKRSLQSIADELEVNRSVVSRWIDKHDILKININNIPQKSLLKLQNKDWLYQKRIIEKLSKEAIAEHLNVSIQPINIWLKYHSIPNVKYNESQLRNLLEDKKWLYDQYIIQNKTCKQIAKEIDSSKSTISIWLNHHKIEISPSNSYPRKFNKTSSYENDIIDWLKANYTGTIKQSDRNLLKGKEIDILLPDNKLAIEVNGTFYHTEAHGKTKYYHLEKTEQCKEQGYTLLHLYEDDIKHRFNICLSMISSKLHLNNRIFARKCKLQPVTTQEKNTFFRNNHIQGADRSTKKFGLYYKEKLVACMTFTKSRFNKTYDWELSRFASKKFTTVVGGFSKLLKHFVKQYGTSIISYADFSYSNGGVYEKNDFQLIKQNPPSYKYVHRSQGIRLHRMGFQKRLLKKRLKNYNPNLTEEKNMLNHNYDKIWDCGNLVYAYQL